MPGARRRTGSGEARPTACRRRPSTPGALRPAGITGPVSTRPSRGGRRSAPRTDVAVRGRPLPATVPSRQEMATEGQPTASLMEKPGPQPAQDTLGASWGPEQVGRSCPGSPASQVTLGDPLASGPGRLRSVSEPRGWPRGVSGPGGGPYRPEPLQPGLLLARGPGCRGAARPPHRPGQGRFLMETINRAVIGRPASRAAWHSLPDVPGSATRPAVSTPRDPQMVMLPETPGTPPPGNSAQQFREPSAPQPCPLHNQRQEEVGQCSPQMSLRCPAGWTPVCRASLLGRRGKGVGGVLPAPPKPSNLPWPCLQNRCWPRATETTGAPAWANVRGGAGLLGRPRSLLVPSANPQ